MNKIIKQAWLSFKSHYGYMKPVDYLLFMIVHPLLQLIFFSLLVKHAYRTNDITPWVIGNSFLMASGSAVFVLGTLIRSEKFQGTLQYVILSPGNQLWIFLSRAIFHFFDIIVKVIIGFIIGKLLFGFNIELFMIPKLMLTILTGIFSGISFGLLVGSFALIIDDINMFLNCVEQVLIIFTGALFSIERLPKIVQPVSHIMPLTRSIKASRLIVNGGNVDISSYLITDILVSIVFLLAAFGLYSVILNIAKKKATLNVY